MTGVGAVTTETGERWQPADTMHTASIVEAMMLNRYHMKDSHICQHGGVAGPLPASQSVTDGHLNRSRRRLFHERPEKPLCVPPSQSMSIDVNRVSFKGVENVLRDSAHETC